MNAVPKLMQGDYSMVPTRKHGPLERCCVCGGKPQVWRYNNTETTSTVAVCCQTGATLPNQSGIALDGGCVLCAPPESFYRPRIADAVEYWNTYQRACVAMRGAS